jgi:hypothetical protein
MALEGSDTVPIRVAVGVWATSLAKLRQNSKAAATGKFFIIVIFLMVEIVSLPKLSGEDPARGRGL